jgi:nondiscriminating aspartyl-tRNA synthetase
MSRILIAEAKTKAGKTVELGAFVQTIRHQGKIVFLVLRDISGTLQAVVFDEKMRKAVDGLTLESVVRVKGEMKKSEQAPDGIEIGVEKLEVLSAAEPELPIPVHEKAGTANQEKRLDSRWIDLRKPRNQLIFKVWTTMGEAVREYWIKQNYVEIHSPKITGTATESGAEVFKVQYFDGEAFLAQSPQFYKQMAMAAGFEKVFEVGPVFRAEPSFTSRHATEFTGYDAEISFIDSHHDVMREHEGMLVATLTMVKERHGDAIKAEFGREVVVPKTPFPTITMAEAKEKLNRKRVASAHAGDLSPEEERVLSEISAKTDKHEFVFVTDYPTDRRPFYHMRHDDDPKLTKSFDLLWNGVEITTGAQREHRPDVLERQAVEKKIDPKAIQFYLNFFRHGCPPHGGYGNGPGRMVMKLLGVDNIREVTFLHRGVNRLTP